MFLSITQSLADLDRDLFFLINHGLANPFLDALFPYVRDSVLWAPLYLFILAFVVMNFGTKGWWWALGFIATVAIADLIGTYGFKETVQRLRPCNEPLLSDSVRLVLRRCPGGYSFLSNHAANHFGLATFMVLTYKPLLGRWMFVAYAWAAFISLAQVYVGVHYPSDIIGGALLGWGAGYLTACLYRHNFGAVQPISKSS